MDQVDLLFRSQRPPGPGANSIDRVKYLREVLKPYAGDLAAWHLVGAEDEPREHINELLLAGIGMAERAGCSRAEGITAARAEWDAGIERATRFLRDLRFRIQQMARAQAPTNSIWEEAKAINIKFDVVLPPQLLEQEVNKLVQATIRVKRRVSR